MVKLNERSEKNLIGVHPDLVKVVRRTAEISDTDFIITEGLRTKERQAQLVKQGASKTMNSRHITGHAVDFAVVLDGEVRWDWPLYVKLAKVFQKAANEVGIKVSCGAFWTRFPDGPHVELDRSKYSA